jgi:hypothetical protein
VVGGGGIYNAGAMTITNSGILGGPGTNSYLGNTATNDGGGVYNAGTMTLDNCLVTGNEAAYSYGYYLGSVDTKNTRGGGIYNAHDAELSVLNSTVSGNSAPKWPDLYSAGGHLYLENSDIGDSKK